MIEKIQFKWYFIWILAFVFLGLSKTYELFYKNLGHSHAQQIALNTQQNISKTEQAFQELINILQTRFHNSDSVSIDQIKSLFFTLEQKNQTKSWISICKKDQLIYWNQNTNFYNPQWCSSITEKASKQIFLYDENYFLNIKSPILLSGYQIHLSQQILKSKQKYSEFNLSETKPKISSIALKDTDKQVLAYITGDALFLDPFFANLLIFTYLIIILLIYIPFHYYAKEFLNVRNYQWAVLVLLFGILLVLSLSQWIVNQHQFYQSFLTDTLIQTNLKNYTLFEFLAMIGILFHLSYFFFKYYKFSDLYTPKNNYDQWIIAVMNYIGILISFLLYCIIYKAIFVNSKFYFSLDNILAFSLENYFLLFNLLLLLLSVFLIAHKLCQSTLSLNLNFGVRMICFIIPLVGAAWLSFKIGINIHPILFILGSTIVIWMMDYFAEREEASILWLISWIIIISFLTSGLIFHYQNEKKHILSKELIEQYLDQIKPHQIDSGQSSSLNEIINKSQSNKLQLYVYEQGSIKYADNIHGPNYNKIIDLLSVRNNVRTTIDQRDIFISKAPNQLVLALAYTKAPLIQAISLFSFLFTILIILSYTIYLINQNYNFLPDEFSTSFSSKPSLKNKIQFYIILGIVFSFVVIAMITYFFTKQSERQIAEENLIEKCENLGNYIESNLSQWSGNSSNEQILQQISENAKHISKQQLEVYDLDGIQLNKSAEFNFLAHPKFFFHFPKESGEVVLNEREQFSNQNQLIACKNLFYNHQKIASLQLIGNLDSGTKSNHRLAFLINTLLNIYVFLFLIAASLATLLANSITNPLEALGLKIKELRLGKRNERLEWKAQDEIGELIQSYNLMVEQLDQSADLLAKSERDSAWREMAKQVAHEIKNPLTPIKLSIQYLQQMIKSGSPDVIPMAEKVSHNILEQIEGLTKIATEFSNFAKMPRAVNEKLLLNDLVSGVHDLFRKREDIDIYLHVTINELYVFCDKDQFIRVLNNLINNAIQAIPETRKGKIDILLQERGKYACVHVKDNGTGIPDEMKSKVFLPNFTTKSSGTGLGLAMCQQIIEAVNGKIYFNDLKPQGTEFVVELPLMKNELQTNS